MSRVASWCLLKKITKHASSLYLCIFEVFEKAEETSETGLFCENCWITDCNLLKVKFNTDPFGRNLPKVVIAALKDKKDTTTI